MLKIPAINKLDGYKTGHGPQYTPGTVKVYSNLTARKSRINGVDYVVFFGMQAIILGFLIDDWNRSFFRKDKAKVIARYQRRMDNYLGKGVVTTEHLEALHDLGYLPLEIKALPEGTKVPIGVPMFTITNTRDEEFWLVNYLETALSNKIWKPITSATIAHEYRKVFEKYYRETVDSTGTGSAAVMYQGHDFSMRGMSGDDDAVTSGAGHLLSFFGTDTIPAIDFLEDFYFADSDNEIIGASIPATEHSVMCMGGKEDEYQTIKRLITELYPSGGISIVSDTWDYWNSLLVIYPSLKDEIMQRVGSPIGFNKVVVRPDSGDPYRIIVGYFPEEVYFQNDKYYSKATDKVLEQHEIDGSIEVLYRTFGGSLTPEGYKTLNEKIGLIYGDSITLERQTLILEGLKRKNFASTTVVLGIGSFTYEYVTRDTFGMAMKATYGEILTQVDSWMESAPELIKQGKTAADCWERQPRELFKDPKTDDGTKKSAKGLLMVYRDDEGAIKLKDQCTWEEEKTGLLQTVFLNGEIVRTQSLAEIRALLDSQL